MGKYILKEMSKNLKSSEKIIIKIFKKTFIKVYKLGVTFGFNNK